MLEKRGV